MPARTWAWCPATSASTSLVSSSAAPARPSLPGPQEKTALLSCDCGEVGCSPLLARVTVDDDTVTWDEFEQPTRPDWDYDGFGFTFSRPEYERALMAILDD